ncbi:MAG: FG-GAP-like repeat-containing protein, partial [Planctomycetota bacterium]
MTHSNRWPALAGITLSLSFVTQSGFAQWVDFQEDPSRISAPNSLVSDDTEEKDYAWGDVDNDGDIDLIIVRKQPFTSTGKRENVLLMNENGVLTDRTSEYATASDVSGDEGFQTPTNDRDVILVDVDGDGWLDIVTAPTLTDNQDKHLSHPRVYMNLGESAGAWQGFRYEDARIPEMHPNAGPRFCSVAGADLTEDGDGLPDLYFGDYDSGGSQIFDYNNRLLINNGLGFFSDQTAARLTDEMALSAFGAATGMGDINNDGSIDVVKQTSLNAPTHVAVTYNNTGSPGFFNGYDVVNSQSPYFVSVGDLNQDGKLDLVITDDGTDVFLLNQGNGGDGQANFVSTAFPDSGGFGGNSVIADLNNDGHNDVIITDIDVDISGCTRRTFIYRNLGNLPDVSFQEQGQVIPDNELTGVHDAAVFDINGDGWLDVVLGRCNGTTVWMNQPPNAGLAFTYPNGLPAFVTPEQSTTIDVDVAAAGGGAPAEGTGKVHVSVDGGAFVESAMAVIGANQYRATLPSVACSSSIEYYFTAEMQGGSEFADPPSAPGSSYGVVSAEGTVIALTDNFEGDVSSWTVVDSQVSTGTWEAVDPNGTFNNADPSAPENDATQGSGNVVAFVTENGVAGGSAGGADLDGGPTDLISPSFSLAGTDGVVSYARWFYTANGVLDELTVWISNNDGGSWTEVEDHATSDTGGDWEFTSFTVGDYITPTSTMRVRFRANDNPNDSITEAGIDNFQIEIFDCGDVSGACCFADGSCNALASADCAGQGGTYQGDLTECGGTSCPQPEGACCFTDGTCAGLTTADCTGQGGTYQGDFTDCGSANCPQPEGACCFADGTCNSQTEADCASAGGTYQGDFTGCGGANCPQPEGACCFLDGSCNSQTAADCSGAGGTYQGNFTACGSANCPQPTGACCLLNGGCIAVESDECSGQGGVYQGDFVTCASVSCPQPVGACCFIDGTCSSLTAADCAAASGTYQGDFTDCASANCP